MVGHVAEVDSDVHHRIRRRVSFKGNFINADKPVIVMVSNVYHPVIGGISSYIRTLEEGLRNKGYRVVVLSIPAKIVLSAFINQHRRVRELFHALFIVYALLRIFILRLRWRVITHGHSANFCLIVAAISTLFGCKGIHTFHSPITKDDVYLRLTSPHADAIIFVSPPHRDYYVNKEIVFNEHIEIAPGAVDTTRFRPSSNLERKALRREFKELGIKESGFLVLYLGRLVENKGVHVLIEGTAEIKRTFPDVQVLIIGSSLEMPADRKYLKFLQERIREMNLEDTILLRPNLPSNIIPGLYRASDVLVCPSLWAEPSPMVVVEALASGLPVVASDVGGLPERVKNGRTGFIVPSGDSTSLAERISEILDNDELRETLAANARKEAEDLYSADKLVEWYSAFYRSLFYGRDVAENEKIVIITPYFHPIKGGITTYISYLANILVLKKRRIKIITKNGSSNRDIFLAHGNKISFILKTLEILKRERPDIIHAHSHWYALLPAFFYKKLFQDTRIVFTFHTKFPKKLGRLRGKIFGQILSECDAVVFVSSSLRTNIEESIDIRTANKVIMAGGFIGKRRPSLEESELLRKKYRLVGCLPLLAFICNFSWKEKSEGAKILISAMGLIRREFSNSKLVLVGSGNYEAGVRAFAREKGLESAVVFTGKIDDVYPIIEIIDIYCHISLQEALPLALLEAMSMGKPVIASDEGGIRDVVDDGKSGILVKADVEEVADAVTKLFKDDARMKTLGSEAKRSIEVKFSWDKAAEEYIRLYRGENE